MEKCVLLITRPYYPSNASGVHRSAAYAKYLYSYGWKPIVVCKKFIEKNAKDCYDPQLAKIPDFCKIVRVLNNNNRLLNKLEKIFFKIIGGSELDYRYPYFLYKKMEAASEEIINTNRIDAIWSTSFPGFDHRIACSLSQKYNIPWIADFRDLPDQSYNNRNIRYVVKQEVKTCSTASVLIATTDELSKKLRSRHSLPVYTIFNGFDPDEYPTHYHGPINNEKFTINHFGLLYRFRNPSPLFKAVDILIQQKKIDIDDICVNFYGANPKMVEHFSMDYSCSPKIHTLNRLPYPEMIACQLESQILLLVSSPQQGGAIPAKLYGYLASRRPILNIPGDGAGTDRIIHQANVGISSGDSCRIAVWLENSYQMWKKLGFVKLSCNEPVLNKFSRKSQTGQLAEILDQVVSKG